MPTLNSINSSVIASLNFLIMLDIEMVLYKWKNPQILVFKAWASSFQI